MARKLWCLLTGMSVLLAIGVSSTQADDTLHFQAMSLARFAETVELPPLRLAGVDGKEISLHSFRGQVILLNFWTTW
jgi:cytochrome oxidase Cu insertion factor (SCO1/SenC/PrrC family)